MTKSTELFLEQFKTLENTIRTYCNGKSVLDYENSQPDGLLKEHLKLCRIARNHLVHSDSEFFEPSKKMLNFLSDLNREVSLASGSVKDVMMSFAKYGCVKPDDTLETAAQVIGKKNISEILVVSDDATKVCLLKASDICKAICEATSFKKTKVSTICSFTREYDTININEPVAKIPNLPFVLVVDDKGKYKGVISQRV